MSRLLSSLAFVVALLASAESLFANEHQADCRYCNALAAWADPPQASNGRNYAPDRQVDVKHIKLDVTPDFEHQTVAGTATIRFAPILKPVKSLRLDGFRLDVSDIRSKYAISDFSVNAAVGHASTHAPQETHSESRNESFWLATTVDWNPRPSIVSARVPCVSSHARTQREQTMHFVGSKVKYGFDVSFSPTRWLAPSMP